MSTREHIDRLMAARLQADIMGAETVIVARTDAEASKLIESNQDPRDHVFIQVVNSTAKSRLALGRACEWGPHAYHGGHSASSDTGGHSASPFLWRARDALMLCISVVDDEDILD